MDPDDLTHAGKGALPTSKPEDVAASTEKSAADKAIHGDDLDDAGKGAAHGHAQPHFGDVDVDKHGLDTKSFDPGAVDHDSLTHHHDDADRFHEHHDFDKDHDHLVDDHDHHDKAHHVHGADDDGTDVDKHGHHFHL